MTQNSTGIHRSEEHNVVTMPSQAEAKLWSHLNRKARRRQMSLTRAAQFIKTEDGDKVYVTPRLARHQAKINYARGIDNNANGLAYNGGKFRMADLKQFIKSCGPVTFQRMIDNLKPKGADIIAENIAA